MRAALVVVLIVATGAAGASRRPLLLTQPTSIELEPAGTLLVVENNPGRILRFDPRSGRVSVLAAGLHQPYSIVRAPSGAIVYSTYTDSGGTLVRLGHGLVERNTTGYGPLAVGRGGAIYYANGVGVFRAGGGRLAPHVRVSGPHGIAVAADGSVLVSDTGNDRVLRIDAHGKATTFARLATPRGIDVAPDGTVYVVDPTGGRVLHLSGTGKPLGPANRRPLPGDPYDVQVGPNGVVYVLETGPVGDIRAIGRDGTARMLLRR